MRYWLLGAACVVYALALLALLHLWPAGARLGLYACYGIAGVTAVVTAFSYAPRDRLRWAWLAFGGGYLIAFASKVFVGDGAAVGQMSPMRAAVWSVMVLLLNVGSLTALALFARAWSGTGLSPPWRTRATLAFLAVALLLDGPTLKLTVQAMWTLHPAAFGWFASVSSNIAAVALVGPIFATAIALRGGLLMRPWLFLFAGAVCWIAVDLLPLMPASIGAGYDIGMRCLAVLFGGAAAIAQLMVKHEVRGLTAE